MQLQEAKRLKALEKENTQLKKLVANQALDIAMLKEIAQGNFQARSANAKLSIIYRRASKHRSVDPVR